MNTLGAGQVPMSQLALPAPTTNEMSLVPYAQSSAQHVNNSDKVLCYTTSSSTSLSSAAMYPQPGALVPFDKQIQLQNSQINPQIGMMDGGVHAVGGVANVSGSSGSLVLDSNNVLSEDTMGNLVYGSVAPASSSCNGQSTAGIYASSNGSESPCSTTSAVLLCVPQIIKKGQQGLSPIRGHLRSHTQN